MEDALVTTVTEEIEDLNMLDIEIAIQEMRNNKSGGIYEITVEL